MLRRIKKLGTREGLITAARFAQHRARRFVRWLPKSPPALVLKALRNSVRRRHLARTIEHVWGPEPLPCQPDEFVVVCLVRNGELYLRSFIEHYTRLGPRQIVFLDNGSDDATLDILERLRQPNMTLLRSTLPYVRYQFLFKEYMLTRYGDGGWRLHVDIDELFDYPRSGEVPFARLLAYLNDGGYTAVVAYLLDMFADGSLQARRSSPDDDLRLMYPFYDISDFNYRSYSQHYGAANILAGSDIPLIWGGIRKTLFESYDWLTKHPLIRLASGLQLKGNVSHDIFGAYIADITAVLYHYKLHDKFIVQTRRAVREKNYYGGSLQYQRYLAVLDKEPDLVVRRPTARRLGSVDELVEQGLLLESPAYRSVASSCAAPASER